MENAGKHKKQFSYLRFGLVVGLCHVARPGWDIKSFGGANFCFISGGKYNTTMNKINNYLVTNMCLRFVSSSGWEISQFSMLILFDETCPNI